LKQIKGPQIELQRHSVFKYTVYLLPLLERSDEVRQRCFFGSVDFCQVNYSMKNYERDFDEILWRGLTRPKEKVIIFWRRSAYCGWSLSRICCLLTIY